MIVFNTNCLPIESSPTQMPSVIGTVFISVYNDIEPFYAKFLLYCIIESFLRLQAIFLLKLLHNGNPKNGYACKLSKSP